MSRKRMTPTALIVFLAVLALAWWLESRKGEQPPGSETTPTRVPTGARGELRIPRTGEGPIEIAFRAKRSKVWVEDEGEIVHLLPDDRRPPRHQLCLVELASGHTIKISHNVDLAPTVPWQEGDRLAFRGRYEFNDKGGVVHWTHRDPDGRHQGGWLEHRGKRYR